MDSPLALRSFDFVPTVEPADSQEEILLSDDPTNLMLNGTYQNISIPLIIGTTSNEGLLMVRQYLLDRDVFNQYNADDSFLVPLSFNLSNNSPSVEEVADEFRSMYFEGKNISSATMNGWSQFHTDAQFKFPTDRTIKHIAGTSTEPIYYYNFSYEGAFNVVKTLLLLGSHAGVCHADDIFYLFTTGIPIPVWPNSHALTIRRRYIRLFTNFAKYGNPTPTRDDLITELWPQYDAEDESYMDIGHDLEAKKHHNQEKLKTWHDYQMRFTGHL